MKLNVKKALHGYLYPNTSIDSDKLKKCTAGDVYEIEIKLTRNQEFHRKVFAFFNFCFAHQKEIHGERFLDEATQFDYMRKKLTIKAGYVVQAYDVDRNRIITTAKSLSFGSMDQDEFERCYLALTQAAMDTIFRDCDQSVYDELISFF